MTLLTQQILDAVDADDWTLAQELVERRDVWLRNKAGYWTAAELRALIADDQRLNAGLSHRKTEVQAGISRIKTGQKAMVAYTDSAL